jgi:hypothetical protein
MAKSRRMSRKGSRKSRGRKSRGRRGGAKSLGLFGRVYSPVNHLFQAAENGVGTLTSGTGSIVRTGLRSVRNVGKSVASHADQAVRNVVSRKGRKSRRGTRKGSRKN